jgi:hypothetical protein
MGVRGWMRKEWGLERGNDVVAPGDKSKEQRNEYFR